MAEPLLTARALTRRFAGVVAVHDVSLDLWRGQIHALIGTNGAGKSTLVNLLAGELAPSSGAIALGGIPVTGRRAHQRAHLGIGRTFQQSNVFADFSAFENCRLAAQARYPRAWALHERAAACATSVANNHPPHRVFQAVRRIRFGNCGSRWRRRISGVPFSE